MAQPREGRVVRVLKIERSHISERYAWREFTVARVVWTCNLQGSGRLIRKRHPEEKSGFALRQGRAQRIPTK